MIIKQLTIFLENKSGRLTDVLKTLGAEKIDVKALTVADTSDFGILRMIVSRPDQALLLLREKGFSVNLTDVLTIATPREAGSFATALSLLSDKNISIEYVYAFSIGQKAVIVMRTEDTERAIRAIQENNMELLDAAELNNL
jgi:hypothetical protein